MVFPLALGDVFSTWMHIKTITSNVRIGSGNLVYPVLAILIFVRFKAFGTGAHEFDGVRNVLGTVLTSVV